jgi:fluoride exporter
VLEPPDRGASPLIQLCWIKGCRYSASMNFLLVMAGGAVGSLARYGVGLGTGRWFGPNYPWGTLAVNLIGGFAMGVLAGTLARMGGSEPTRALIGVGLLGGFTTFSAFSLDTVTMIERGQWGVAAAYVLVSVIGSVLALFAGLYAVRALA